MKKKLKTREGITLIALIITIIVMLILVAVTISMAINGGLFEKAGEAVGEMQNAVNKEQELANGKIEIGGVWYDSIDDYINGMPSYIHNWTRTGDTFTCSHCGATYEMGQVVNYTAAGKTSTTISATKSGLDRYYANNSSSYPSNANADANGVQTIEKQGTNWIVLGIEDTNKDGINETLLITTAEPVSSSAVGDGALWLYGAAAYNNAASYIGADGKKVEGEIDRICRELYSNNEYGNARGMAIEDVNRALNYEPIGGYYSEDGGRTWKTTGNLTTKLKDVPVFSSLKANGTKTPKEPNTDNEEALGEYELNGYTYFSNGTVLANPINSNTSAITESEHNTIFGSSTDYVYWLASRGVCANSGYAFFGPGFVYCGGAGSYYYVFDSDGGEGDDCAGLRPVVSLKSKLPTVISGGSSENPGNSGNNEPK